MEFRRVLCRSLGGEATFGGLTPVGGDVSVELVDGEVVKELFAGEHDGQVLAGLDGDVARVEREVGGGHFDLAGAVGDRAVLLVVVVTAAVAVGVHAGVVVHGGHVGGGLVLVVAGWGEKWAAGRGGREREGAWVTRGGRRVGKG